MARLLTAQEVADQLGVKVPTVWAWQKKGRIPHSVKLGTCTRWNSDDIDRFIESLSAGEA